MSKNVQIPEELFFLICRYYLTDDMLEPEDIQAIENGLTDKLNAMQKRAAYTAYKDRKLSPSEREAARQQYLDLIGLLPGYRWSSLDPPI